MDRLVIHACVGVGVGGVCVLCVCVCFVCVCVCFVCVLCVCFVCVCVLCFFFLCVLYVCVLVCMVRIVWICTYIRAYMYIVSVVVPHTNASWLADGYAVWSSLFEEARGTVVLQSRYRASSVSLSEIN